MFGLIKKLIEKLLHLCRTSATIFECLYQDHELIPCFSANHGDFYVKRTDYKSQELPDAQGCCEGTCF